MSGEVLEGVLSETILDELAADLGIDPKDLRKSPFFRVLKGRVLLTYPLKTVGNPIFRQNSVEQEDPVATTYYPITTLSGAGIFYNATVRKDDATVCQRRLRVTLDGIALVGVTDNDNTMTYWHWDEMRDGHTLAERTVDGLRDFAIPFRNSLVIEMYTSVVLGAGQKLQGTSSYGEAL